MSTQKKRPKKICGEVDRLSGAICQLPPNHTVETWHKDDSGGLEITFT